MLAEKATKLTMEVNVIKETLWNCFGCEAFENMNAEEFELMQKLFKTVNLSMEIVEEQAKTIENINEKLDKLLAMKDRA